MDVQENPASRGLRRPGRPQRGSSTVAREVRCASSHRNMGTLKIHAMSPVHYVQARPARAPRLREEGRPRRPSAAAPPRARRAAWSQVQCREGRRAGPRGAGRGKRGGGRAGDLAVLEAPAPVRASSRPLLQRLLRRGKARLRKRAAQPGRQSGAPAGRSGLWCSRGGRSSPSQPRWTWPPDFRKRGKEPGRGHGV